MKSLRWDALGLISYRDAFLARMRLIHGRSRVRAAKSGWISGWSTIYVTSMS